MRPGPLIVVSPRRSKLSGFPASWTREKQQTVESTRILPQLQPLSPRKLSGQPVFSSSFRFPTIRPRLASDSGLISPRARENPSFRIHFAASQVGSVLGKPKAHNQDACFYSDISPQSVFFGVCDGHGQSGHHVSQFLTSRFPETLSGLSRMETNEVRMLIDTYERVNDALKNQHFDRNFSGSTCVSVLITADAIFCANVGDSRAVLCRKSRYSVQAIPLSTDHKPDLPSERQRILQKGGRIAPVFSEFQEPIGPARIWLQDEDMPGLAMSRAMGDYIATSIGLIAVPGNWRLRGDETGKDAGRPVRDCGF